MSNKNFTTRTASLKATSIDAYKTKTNKLTINDIPFSKVISSNVPENPTDNDMWKYVATTDDKGVVTINSDISFDYSEMTDEQKAITKTAVKVIDNKVLGDNDELLMNWDSALFTNSNNSDMNSIFGGTWGSKATITEWNSDLSSLTNGTCMFKYCTNLASFNSDLSSLNNGYMMFCGTALTEWDIDLSNLTNGQWMFLGCSKLTAFDSDLSSLTYGEYMFYNTTLTEWDIDLPNLTDGSYMFLGCPLTEFTSDLKNLTNGDRMFYLSALASFNSDLSSLTNGSLMFLRTALTTFNSDLPSLTNGNGMFRYVPLKSFNSDLSNLTDGELMFFGTALTSFNSDLSSLIDGSWMFASTQARHYNISFYEVVDGVKTLVTKTIQSEGLKEVVSNFSSLKSGYCMFGNNDTYSITYTDDNGNEVTETTYNISPLSEESIMFIAETINDIRELDTTNDDDWKYTYINNRNEFTSSISSSYRGIIHLGYDSSITDTTNIMKYCDQIANKGWTVFLNGSQQTPNNGAIETANLSDDNVQTPIPHYYKPLQVTDDDVAKYVDSNGNYYIIIGGQHIFGDDISTYGMFTSYEHAISEITLGLGLTKYVKPTEEKTESKEEK